VEAKYGSERGGGASETVLVLMGWGYVVTQIIN
jgi:hypothetical protein